MSTIGDLPHSLVASKILSDLDLQQYAPLSTVSRIFRDLVYSDYPWIGPLRERGIVALPGTARQTFISHLRRVCTLIIDALPKVDQKARIKIEEVDKSNIVQLYQSITGQLTQSTVKAIFSQILPFPDLNCWEFPEGDISPEFDFSLRACIEVGKIEYLPHSHFSRMIKAKCSVELFSIFITKQKYIVDQGDVVIAISRDLPDRTVYLLASSVKPTEETKTSLIVRTFLDRNKKFPEEMILSLVAQHPVCINSIYMALTRGYSEPLIKVLFNRYLETNPSDLDLTGELKALHVNNGCLYSDELILEFILHATEVKLEPLLREMYQARTETKSRAPTERVARAIVEKFPKSACEALPYAPACGYSEEFLLTYLDAAASHNPDLDTSRLIQNLSHHAYYNNTPYPEQLILASLSYASSISDWILWYAVDKKVSPQTVRKLAEKVKEVEISTLVKVIISLPSEIPEQRYLDDETLKIIIAACQDIHLFPLDRALGTVSDEVLKFLLLRPVQIDKRTIHKAIGCVSEPIARILFRRGVEMFGKRTMYDDTFLWEILRSKLPDDLTLEVIKEYDEIDNSTIELAKRLDCSKIVLHALEGKLPYKGYIFF